MTNTEFAKSPKIINSNPNNLIFGLEDNPPFQTAFLVSLQHVCVVFVPSVTPAILIGRALNLDKVINPNTTVSMTEKISAIARSVANPGTEIIARHLVHNYGMTHLCRQIRAFDLLGIFDGKKCDR